MCCRGDFLCTFCRSLTIPEIEYCDDSRKIKGEQSLNPEDQRVSSATTSLENGFLINARHLTLYLICLQKCERLLLYIFCHELSMGFREPVPSSVSNCTRRTQTLTDHLIYVITNEETCSQAIIPYNYITKIITFERVHIQQMWLVFPIQLVNSLPGSNSFSAMVTHIFLQTNKAKKNASPKPSTTYTGCSPALY